QGRRRRACPHRCRTARPRRARGGDRAHAGGRPDHRGCARRGEGLDGCVRAGTPISAPTPEQEDRQLVEGAAGFPAFQAGPLSPFAPAPPQGEQRTKMPETELSEAEAAELLVKLADEVAAHDIRYYQEDAPSISDAEYDALRRRIAELEAKFPHLVPENSPSLRVGAPRAEQFSPVEHGVPMLSLDNAFSDEEAAEFDARIRRFLKLDGTAIAYTAEPKIDGLSASLRYEDGVLVQGATRGEDRKSTRLNSSHVK